jgi:hypothetical protein
MTKFCIAFYESYLSTAVKNIFYTQLKSLSSFFTQVYDSKSTSYVSSSGGVCMAASKEM